jgi:predicted amidohydrolase YtcJ
VLIRNVEIEGEAGLDVRTAAGRIAAIGHDLEAASGAAIVQGRGGALLPGLHDHHLHLYALAAARNSVRCGPPEVHDEAGLAQALRAAAQAGTANWIRGVGYHESVAGDLDARRLDALLPGTPVRIQHRSGAMWILNSTGLEKLVLGLPLPAGVERTPEGRPNGRFLQLDDWLRQAIGGTPHPHLGDVGALLARFGVTGVTDATPSNGPDALWRLSRAIEDGALRQRLRLMGTADLPLPAQAHVTRGAVKLVLREFDLPAFDALHASIEQAHAAGREVAVHCVTRAELVLALGAFEAAGSQPGDRIEHASIAPPELATQIAAQGLAVVTQPNFIRERGDAYAAEVAAVDRPWLYRCQGLLEAGVSLGGGTDAPFGDPDPWLAMQAALDRRSPSGILLGEQEALSPERALALFTTPSSAPGGSPRRVALGEPADLCLLDRPWARARDSLASESVGLTCVAEQVTWRADEFAPESSA